MTSVIKKVKFYRQLTEWIVITLCLLVSSAFNFYEQFGTRLGPTKHGA